MQLHVRVYERYTETTYSLPVTSWVICKRCLAIGTRHSFTLRQSASYSHDNRSVRQALTSVLVIRVITAAPVSTKAKPSPAVVVVPSVAHSVNIENRVCFC